MVEATEIVVVAFCLASTVVLGLRIYIRVILARQWILEVPLVVAFCFQIGLLFLTFEQLKLIRRLNSHNDVAALRKLFFTASFFYFGALWSVKVSVNLLHIRITRKITRVYTWAVRSLYVIVFLWLLVNITMFLGCHPFTRKWDSALGKAKPCPPCNKQWDFWFHFAANIATDIWLCILPFPALAQITTRRVRVAIFSVYGLASLTIIVSAIRAALLGINSTTYGRSIMVLGMIEVATAIIVGSLPCICSSFTNKYIHGSSNKSYATSGPKGIDRSWNEQNLVVVSSTELGRYTTKPPCAHVPVVT